MAIASERRNAIDFFRKIGIVKNRVGNAILAGGGKVSYYLAKSLLASGIRVTIIEVDRERCDILSELLPHATVICGMQLIRIFFYRKVLNMRRVLQR